MINYVDDLNIKDLKENKNLLIAAKKIKEKHKKNEEASTTENKRCRNNKLRR